MVINYRAKISNVSTCLGKKIVFKCLTNCKRCNFAWSSFKRNQPEKNKPQPSSNAFQHCTFNFKGSIQRFFRIKKQELFVVSSAVPPRGEAEAAPRRVDGMKAFRGLDASLELGLIWPGPPLWIPAKSHESHMETHMDIYENHGSDMETYMFFPR